MGMKTKSGCKKVAEKVALEELGGKTYRFWLSVYYYLDIDDLDKGADHISKKIGISKPTFRKYVELLEESGYISLVRTDHRQHNRYVLLKSPAYDFEKEVLSELKGINKILKTMSRNMKDLVHHIINKIV